MKYYKNFYTCPKCKVSWMSVDDCCCNDECGDCLIKDIEPTRSENFKD